MATNPLMNLIPSVGMGLNQSYSSGGSVNSANSAGWSQSGTMADQARAWSEAQSALAWNRNLEAMRMQMEFNAAEAQKQRDWQEQMANTVYTRSVKNMREAGINPILAANMGLSGSAVGSGATASIGGAPSAPLAQNFMDSWSASQNASESHGSSWSSSEGGLVTALSALGSALAKGLGAINSGMNMTLNFAGMEQSIRDWQQAERDRIRADYENEYDPNIHQPGSPGGTANNSEFYDLINAVKDKIGGLLK